MPLNSGDTFAGYRIIRLLGSGGMGEVYLAQHPRLPRRDALKLLPRDWSNDHGYRARFIREADLASTLWHPGIVGVHDRGEHDGQLWISMDFVDGKDLGRVLTKRYPAGMPYEHVVEIVNALAGALDYAHKQGLLHRDIKPANIMLTNADSSDEKRVVLADFGIARSVDDISGLTTTNTAVGTVAYAAPEQLMGEETDGRADLYALAATTYHLLTGTQPFPHSNPAVVISHHLNSPPPSLSANRPELAALDEVLAEGLAKKPEDRFQRVTDFARALSGLSPAGGASHPTRPALCSQRSESIPLHESPPESGALTKQGAFTRRKYGFIGVAATIVIGSVVATAVLWRPWQEPRTATSQGVQAGLPSSQPIPTHAPTVAGPATSELPSNFPDVLPTNSGCRGDVVDQKDIEHKFLGPIRIFLTLSGTGFDKVGCVAPVAVSGKVLEAIHIRVTNHFGFPSPATDTTGNTFVTYNPGRYDGVLVLVPTRDGFADIGWESTSTPSYPSYWGRYAIYYAELVGPGPDGQYTIRQSSNDCNPSCAEGTTTYEDLRWNGADYVAANPPDPHANPPSSQAIPTSPPSVNLESACSNPEWREANGAEGDRLCGAPYPFR
ncbi:serine/threonine protein kinase [Mycolicibacterium wolinskyi]|uniref:serine/threonine-protein kinase n=1 Tax=Mycolicibacterium goodii TaxID=134601 RepID=UPI000A168A24|nr:serine/threonine protein kinase [Mycolicibacterium wolinskyi]MCV7291176.1 serine/threonine protein kinase [Mycolicibacterium goodii]